MALWQPQQQAQNTNPDSAADEVRRVVSEQGIEFLFAQFVDMHGKPSAKLVPAHHIDDLLTDGAGFAGFAAGDIGQGPHDPDMIAIPDPESLHGPAVEAERRAVCVRRHGRGRTGGGAVLPAHDPAQRAGPRQGARFRAADRRRARVLPAAPDRRRRIAPADPLDTLDLPCYDMRALTRNLDFVSLVSQRSRRWGGTTTRPTTRTPTGSSSRTSSSPTR
jgi:Glutamine synthetase